MRALQLVLFFIHGLIHLMGFSKAFGLAAINQVSQSISKAHGFFWFVAASLFMATAVIFFLRLEWWWMLAVGAVLLSQYLIIVSWEDAKFGTIGNALSCYQSSLAWRAGILEIITDKRLRKVWLRARRLIRKSYRNLRFSACHILSNDTFTILAPLENPK